ncbi:macro domain-containing protein [Nostoc sp. CHAB 5834]|nr:macro domain-containing protein [Nostoc sp. CHAB 5834]
MKVKTGSLLDVTEGIIVHGCNCQGKMGSGIALFIKNKWPSVYSAYAEEFRQRGLHLGQLVSVGSTSFASQSETLGLAALTTQLPPGLIAVNAMTQRYYGNDKSVRYVDYDAVRECFRKVKNLAVQAHVAVNFNLIGAGLANGNWDEIKLIIDDELGDVDSTLWVLPPT